jgi:hypothetical protein
VQASSQPTGRGQKQQKICGCLHFRARAGGDGGAALMTAAAPVFGSARQADHPAKPSLIC